MVRALLADLVDRALAFDDSPVMPAPSRSIPTPAYDTTPCPSARTLSPEEPLRYCSPAKCLPASEWKP